jgi:PAS domain S-box-containing protein
MWSGLQRGGSSGDLATGHDWMGSKSRDELTSPDAALRREGATGPSAIARPGDQQAAEAARRLPLNSTERLLILVAVVLFLLGTLLDITGATAAIRDTWPLAGVFLALPLLALVLGMVLQRRSLDQQRHDARAGEASDQDTEAVEGVASRPHADRILELLADGVTTLDRDWRITSVNPAAERMLGHRREALIGRNAWSVFGAVIGTPVHDTAQQAMRDGRPATVQHFAPSTGTWFEVRYYPLPDGMSVVFHDVSKWVKLTDDLQASEARYRALVEQVPVVIYLLAADEHATRLYFSPHLTELTGYTPEEALAQQDKWLEWVHPDDRARVEALDVESTAEGRPYRAEYRHRRKDGSYVWVLDECLPIRDENGVQIGWQGILLDITPRKEAEEVKARLAALVDSAEDAIYSTDLEAIVTSWNRGAEKLYGYTADEMVGKSMLVLLPEGEIQGDLAERVAAVQAGKAVESYTTVRRRKDGSLVDVTVSLSSIRDQDGNVTGLSAIMRDISAWKHAEEQLHQALEAARSANETKSQFLAMMSHELRTPLQAVLGYTEFLLTNPASKLSEEERVDLGYIQQGGQRMLSLVNQLLDLSRLEAGRLAVRREAVDLSDVMEQVRQDVAPQVQEKGLALEIELPATLPAIAADPERLRQILLNLVGNAVKFTDEGSVTVRAEAQGAAVAITVTDTGIGIAPEELPHIFEAFRQADSRLARRHSGAGLGLAIAQGLAELMDGQLAVESALGTGTTFTLTMPVFLGVLPEPVPAG